MGNEALCSVLPGLAPQQLLDPRVSKTRGKKPMGGPPPTDRAFFSSFGFLLSSFAFHGAFSSSYSFGPETNREAAEAQVALENFRLLVQDNEKKKRKGSNHTKSDLLDC